MYSNHGKQITSQPRVVIYLYVVQDSKCNNACNTKVPVDEHN